MVTQWGPIPILHVSPSFSGTIEWVLPWPTNYLPAHARAVLCITSQVLEYSAAPFSQTFLLPRFLRWPCPNSLQTSNRSNLFTKRGFIIMFHICSLQLTWFCLFEQGTNLENALRAISHRSCLGLNDRGLREPLSSQRLRLLEWMRVMRHWLVSLTNSSWRRRDLCLLSIANFTT